MNKRAAAALAALMAFGVSATAEANVSSARQQYVKVRVEVVKQLGHRAPGRDIRTGLRTSTGGVRIATRADYRRVTQTLRAMIDPPAYLAVAHVGAPRVPPAYAQTASYTPTGTAACIVQRESGGNPTAQNGQYEGIAQWSPEAWSRMGGTQYASHPAAATKQDQLKVLSAGLAKYGKGDWGPYDGC